MKDTERRLQDLRQATHGRVRPSPELWARIESSVTPRVWGRWPQAVALAAIAAVALAVATTRPGGDDQPVAAGPPTYSEYVAAMNQRCEEYIREAGAVVVVFATPEAYTLGAENRIAALARSLERFRSVGTPVDAPSLLQQLTQEATAAQASAQAALEAARGRDTATAAAALAEADAAVTRIGRLLSEYGAERCRPPGAP